MTVNGTIDSYSIRLVRNAREKHCHCDNLFAFVGRECTIHEFHNADSAANPIKGKWVWHDERIWNHIYASERPLISGTKTLSSVFVQYSRLSLHCLLQACLSWFIIRPFDGCVSILKTPGFWYVCLNTNLRNLRDYEFVDECRCSVCFESTSGADSEKWTIITEVRAATFQACSCMCVFVCVCVCVYVCVCECRWVSVG